MQRGHQDAKIVLGQKVPHDGKIVPVSRGTVKNGAWNGIEVGTVTKKQGGELTWSETWVEDGGSESCDDVELWGSDEWRWSFCRVVLNGLEGDR